MSIIVEKFIEKKLRDLSYLRYRLDLSLLSKNNT